MLISPALHLEICTLNKCLGGSEAHVDAQFARSLDVRSLAKVHPVG